MSKRKLGEGFAQRWAELGLNELRNAAAFENSNVVDDIRRSTSTPQQELNQFPQPAPEQSPQQDPNLDLHLER